MDLPHIDLQKILLSPKPGMDLKKGVPGQGKIESQGSGHFEGFLETSKGTEKKDPELKDQRVRNSGHTAKADSQKIRKCISPKSSELDSSQENHEKSDSSEMDDTSISRVEASDEADNSSSKSVADDTEKDVDATKVEPMAIQIASLPLAQREAQDSEFSDGKITEAESSGNAPAATENSQSSIPENLLNQNQIATDSKMASKVEPKIAKEKSETISDKLMSDLDSISNSDLRFGDSEQVSIKDLKDLNAFETKAPSLKSMVDSLWVQTNLENASPNQPIVLAQPGRFEIGSTRSTQPMMRTELVNDMKPLISHVLTTQNGGEMTLSLRPENLGLVRVDVKVESGDVKVAIHAEQSAAKNMLQNDIQDLKRQLGSAGLHVNELSVQLMKADDAHFQKNENLPQQQRQPEQQTSNFFKHDQDDGSREKFEEAMDDSHQEQMRRKVA